MLLYVTHVTELRYSERVSETVMEVRMTPRSNAHQTVRGSRLQIGPPATLLEYDDWLGNRVHQFSVLAFHDRLVMEAESAVDLHPRSPRLDATPDPVLVATDQPALEDFRRLGGLVDDDPRLDDLARALGLDECERAGEVALRVMLGLRDHLEYRKGATSSATTLSQVLDAGAGVCQDLTHVALGLLRRRGIPARYVSGYLYRERGSEHETHAWCDLHLPSAGWVAIDPTAKAQGDAGHVTMAVGRDFSDVPPNRGVFRGNADESIEVQVTIEPIAELPDGLLKPRGPGLDVRSYSEGPRVHREAIEYQQEQQQQ